MRNKLGAKSCTKNEFRLSPRHIGIKLSYNASYRRKWNSYLFTNALWPT